MTVSDYPDWQTPQAHATKIAATGVPLLRASNSLASGAAQTVGPLSSKTLLNAAAVTQPGYEIGVRLSMPAGTGTLPFLQLELLWTDSLTGVPTARRDVLVTAGNGPANQVTSFVNGPCRGNLLTVTITSFDPAVTTTLDFTINQTSHVYEHDQSGQLAYAPTAPNGFTNPSGIPSTGVLMWEGTSIAASGNIALLCALYGGDVLLSVDASGIASAVKIVFTDPSGFAAGGTGSHLFTQSVAAGATLILPMALPDLPVLVTLSNAATSGSIAPQMALIAQNH